MVKIIDIIFWGMMLGAFLLLVAVPFATPATGDGSVAMLAIIAIVAVAVAIKWGARN